MRRLLDAADWPWSDNRNQGHTRYTYFARSGEAITSLFLAAYVVVMLWPGSSFTSSVAFHWLLGLTRGDSQVWAAYALALAITGPLALHWDSGSLRILSMVSQGTFFMLLANSVRLGSPPSLLVAMLLVSGCWLLVRAGFLLRHHLHWGGERGKQQQRGQG